MAEGNSSCDLENDSSDIIMNFNGESQSTLDKNGKREHIVVLKDSDVTVEDPKQSENNKKMKKESISDGQIFNNNNGAKSKRHNRSYRSRILESSSSDNETNELHTLSTENLNSAKPDSPSENQNNEVDSHSSNGHENQPEDPESRSNSQDNNVASSTNLNGAQEGESNTSPTLHTNEERTSQQNDSSDEVPRPLSLSGRVRRFFSNFPLNSDSDDDLSDLDVENEDNESTSAAVEERAAQKAKRQERINCDVNEIFDKPAPQHQWKSLNEIIHRQYGMSANRQASVLFKNRFYDSLYLVEKLDRVSKLAFHDGCVNALSFSDSGELLASSSDDLQIAVWDWKRKETRVTYNSGHRNNVFQCKFLPLAGNAYIASCARDGQVRLAELQSSGVHRETRRIAKHSKSAHKLATRTNAPYEVMSAGEDAFVLNIDIRSSHPDKIVLVKDVRGNRVPLYSIHQHPLNDDQFCVSGQDQYVRVYDRRIISPFGPPVLKYCPQHLLEKKYKPSVTCAVYSSNGDAILASYSDEDIYIFDTSLSEGAPPAHKYSGHRNSSTIKGVNFFSPSSNFVVSGSDCGNIFFWDRKSEAIANCLPGDDIGVVNVLEPHPHLPILATSGLDNDVKMWVPSPAVKRSVSDIKKAVRDNLLKRFRSECDPIDTQVLMMMFQHMHRSPMTRRTRNQSSAEEDDQEMILDDSSDSVSTDDEVSDDDQDAPGPDLVQCSTQ